MNELLNVNTDIEPEANSTKSSVLLRLTENTPGLILLYALWFGLLTGLAEAAYQGFRFFYLHRILGLSKHFLWMIPVADVVSFLFLGILLAVIAIILPKLPWRKIAIFSYSVGFVMSIYAVRPKISIWAALILAVGLATQAVFVDKKYLEKIDHLMIYTMPVMIIMVIALIVISFLFVA